MSVESPPKRAARSGAPRRRMSRPVAGLLRRQLAAYSPLSLRGIVQAALPALASGGDPRPALRDVLSLAYSADSVLLTGSGAQALELALRAARNPVGETPTPIVALPAFTCFEVASAAVGAGFRIALYDIEPHTLAPDLDSLAAVLSWGAQIVVAAPLYGVPFDWQAVEDLAAGFGATVIEDAAQGHGARWGGRTLGSLGAISVLSFGRGKGWTGNRGGAVLCRRGSLAGAGFGLMAEPGPVAEMSVILAALTQWGFGRPSWYALPASLPFLGLGETRYRDPEPPAAMGRAAAGLIEHTRPLAELEEFARRANALDLLARMPVTDDVNPVRCQPGGEPGYLRLPVLLSGGLGGFARPREALHLGIAPGYPSTLAELPAVRARLAQRIGRWPGAETLVHELVTLPTHSRLTTSDRAALGRLFEQYPQ